MTRRPPSQADSHVLPEGGQPGPACRLGVGWAGGVHPHVVGSWAGGTSPPGAGTCLHLGEASAWGASWPCHPVLVGQLPSVWAPLCCQLAGALSFGSSVRRPPAPQDRGSHITVASGFGVCTHQGESDTALLREVEICSRTEPFSSLPVFLLPSFLSLDPTPSETWEGWRGGHGEWQPPSLHTEREQEFF